MKENVECIINFIEGDIIFYKYQQYKEWINMSLENKIMWSEQVILKAIKNSKTGFSISLSWGKDSIVMCHLINKFCKKGKIIFANTQCEYPETYKYRDMMLKEEFLSGCEYYETKPLKTFFECVKLYGFPHNRQSSEQDKKGEKSKRTPKCCFYLKEKPLSIKQKELDIDLVFIGIQATESMNRRLVFLRLSEYYFNKTNNVNICMPMAIWNDKNIFDYAKKNNIKINPLYNQMKRTGCMYCTGFKKWKEVMANYDIKLYSRIQKQKDSQSSIYDYECKVLEE